VCWYWSAGCAEVLLGGLSSWLLTGWHEGSKVQTCLAQVPGVQVGKGTPAGLEQPEVMTLGSVGSLTLDQRLLPVSLVASGWAGCG
jgi:hypothetical protein